MRIPRIVLGSLALFLLGLAITWWAWPTPRDSIDSNPTPRASESLAPHPTGPQKLARRAPPELAETSPTWNMLSASERVRRLESTFEDAIADLESGDVHAAARASDALTALRFELYATPQGQQRHMMLEDRLEQLSEGQK